MAKAPKPGTTPTATAEADEDATMRLVLDDEIIVIDAREFSAEEGNALRRASGFSLEYHMAQFDDGDLSLDIVLGIVWVVKRRTKSQLSYRKFLREQKYDSVKIEFPDAEDDPVDVEEVVDADEGFTPSGAV